VPQSWDADTRPVVLALVEDRVGSLASLLLAAEIAVVQQARLHVAHIASPRMWWVGAAGMTVPAHQWAEADCLAADQLREYSNLRCFNLPMSLLESGRPLRVRPPVGCLALPVLPRPAPVAQDLANVMLAEDQGRLADHLAFGERASRADGFNFVSSVRPIPGAAESARLAALPAPSIRPVHNA
jgi:hypothetical protein